LQARIDGDAAGRLGQLSRRAAEPGVQAGQGVADRGTPRPGAGGLGVRGLGKVPPAPRP
jgi:hypothetical protein